MEKLKIAIIGSGLIGGTLARLLVKAGYEVALTNSRGPASLQNFVDELGEKLHPVNLEQALGFGDVIIVSIHWIMLDNLPVSEVQDKIIIDTTNPYNTDGTVVDLKGELSSSKVVEHFPGGRVVKAFNTIWYKHLREHGDTSLDPEKRHVIPIAGDNAEAKNATARIIDEIGFAALDTGTLSDGSKLQEPGTIYYGKDLTLEEARAMLKTPVA